MIYIEAPSVYQPTDDVHRPSIFLAGGITGCPDWQQTVVDILSTADAVVFNPRRADFPIGDPGAAAEQITWEYRALWDADLILFWFPAGQALQPIALYELGAHRDDYRIVVGTDPGYPRAIDVRMQLKLARPGLTVHDTLSATVMAALMKLDREWPGTWKGNDMVAPASPVV